MHYLFPMQTIFESMIHLNENDLENLPFHYHLKDKNGKYIACNKRAFHDAGFNKTEGLLGLTDFDLNFLPKKQAIKFRENDKYVIKTGEGKFFIENLTQPSSNQCVAMTYKVPLFSSSKKIIGNKSLSFVIKNVDSNFIPREKYLPTPSASKDDISLTKRQSDCVFYLIKGMTVKQIALTLNLAPKTVEHYLEAAKIKLKCNTRFELIERALKLQSLREKFFSDLR